MAELPDRWTDRAPELFGRVPAFGPPRDAERLGEGIEPLPPAPPARKRETGPFLTYLCLPWSYGDRGTWDFWHRMRCRLGRHEMAGGHPMQVAGSVVFVERQCRWCDVGPC